MYLSLLTAWSTKRSSRAGCDAALWQQPHRTTPQPFRPPPHGRYQRLDGDTAQRLWVQAHEQAGRQRNTAGARIRRISLLGGLVLPVRCRGGAPLGARVIKGLHPLAGCTCAQQFVHGVARALRRARPLACALLPPAALHRSCSASGVQVWDAVSEALQQQVRAVDRKLSVLRLQTTGAAPPHTPVDGRSGS